MKKEAMEVKEFVKILDVDNAEKAYKDLCKEVINLVSKPECKKELKEKGMRLHDTTMQLIARNQSYFESKIFLIASLVKFKVNLEKLCEQ